MSKYYQFDKNFNKDELYTFIRPNKYHNLKKDLPEIGKQVFAIVIDKKGEKSRFSYDTIEIKKLKVPICERDICGINHCINAVVIDAVCFGFTYVEYNEFCNDDTKEVYWFDIDHKHFINSLFGEKDYG